MFPRSVLVPLSTLLTWLSVVLVTVKLAKEKVQEPIFSYPVPPVEFTGPLSQPRDLAGSVEDRIRGAFGPVDPEPENGNLLMNLNSKSAIHSLSQQPEQEWALGLTVIQPPSYRLILRSSTSLQQLEQPTKLQVPDGGTVIIGAHRFPVEGPATQNQTNHPGRRRKNNGQNFEGEVFGQPEVIRVHGGIDP